MTRLVLRALSLFVMVLALTGGRAVAQDNRDAGKKPAELFANDCSGCHKSPAGLAKAPGMFGLESFLREHYTASRQSATLIANYLRSVDAEQGGAAANTKRRRAEPKPKSGDKPAARSESKPDAKVDAKPTAEKPAEPKATETKPAESKPAETKPAETKPPAESSPPAATQEKSN